ncbi:EamA family transporter [Paenibacillus turpanensis]|uniref:EamA family transporter n=1 Tax=Paenibacillus turpanensis TaxID=2689078 RepID=UPI00140C74BC|nr:EamA family transporter [Paenibacillus turpanensis]
MLKYVLAFISILLGASAQIMLKKGSGALNGVKGSLVDTVMKVALNPFIIGGFVLYGLSAVTWVAVLSKMKLSVAYPLVSLSYVIVVIASYFIFKETIVWTQIVALAFIVIGVLLLVR